MGLGLGLGLGLGVRAMPHRVEDADPFACGHEEMRSALGAPCLYTRAGAGATVASIAAVAAVGGRARSAG